MERRAGEDVKFRRPCTSLEGLFEFVEWRVGAVRVVGSSAAMRDERKERWVVTVVKRPVATSLEANLASGQMNVAAVSNLYSHTEREGAALPTCVRDMRA